MSRFGVNSARLHGFLLLTAVAVAVAVAVSDLADGASPNVCADPGSSPKCNTCDACCHSFIPAGGSCDQCVTEKCGGGPQRLIIDTDMGFDVDDAVAVCLANALHMKGMIDLLAVVHDTGCELGAGGVSSINHFYGHDNITVGAWKGKYGSNCNQHYDGTSGQNQYLSHLVDKMPGPVTSASHAMLGTDAYRKVLAAAPNASVNVASIGMPTNLADLLATPPDKYSPLSGYALVAAKVNKVVYMDGMYNFGCAAGNIGPSLDCYGDAEKALKMPPSVRQVFSSKGENPDIYTGSGIPSSHPPNSPCREALTNWCCNPNGKRGDSGRLSWDPITVMIASLDVGSVFEKEVNYGTQVTADADGHEHFFGSGTKNAQTDFNEADAPSKIRAAIDGYLDNVIPGQTPGWNKHHGDNCYGDRDGHGSHGATDLEHPPSAPAGAPMTVAACQVICRQTPSCTGVTVQLSGRGDQRGLYDCYRKGNIDLAKCDHNTAFDTYTYDGGDQRQH